MKQTMENIMDLFWIGGLDLPANFPPKPKTSETPALLAASEVLNRMGKSVTSSLVLSW